MGIACQEDDQGHIFAAALGALTLTYSPTDRISPFIDVGAQSPETARGTASVVIDAGLAYIIGPDLQLDLSAGRGVHGATPSRPFVAIGASFRRR